jgi:hypothetical protein
MFAMESDSDSEADEKCEVAEDARLSPSVADRQKDDFFKNVFIIIIILNTSTICCLVHMYDGLMKEKRLGEMKRTVLTPQVP